MEPIAIVGSACRFPGSATSPAKLWELLKSPRNVLRQFPAERLAVQNFYNANGEYHGRTDVKGSSYLLDEDPRLFDASFFRISPKEAESMDPQQRIILETVFESLESAGRTLHMMEGSNTGVYVGVMTADYHDIQMRDPDSFATYTATGTARSILSNRVSYVFDLKGPSITFDTACSSSLVALHQAVQALRNGETSQAIVAGSTLLLDPSMYIAESNLHMLSPDSRSRMWDAAANGYARGEGCAAVVLKPLSKAIQDNDHIECIIRASGVNSDGRTKGITMPSAEAQTALIRQTYAAAGLDPAVDRCEFFECHGTGTLAGDPVEARAVHDAFFPDGAVHDKAPVYCGSIKTIIGHLEGCAGLAGVLKASLALQNKSIPPNMHFNKLNPEIAPYYGNLQVPTKLSPMVEQRNRPLRASVNSFGFGGTNAHVILERYEHAPVGQSEGRYEISSNGLLSSGPFVFSAKSRSALHRQLESYRDYIDNNEEINLDTLRYILQSRRTIFPVRSALPASSRKELLQMLTECIGLPEEKIGIQAVSEGSGSAARILGVFTGQGAQSAQMGKALMERCAKFRESIVDSQSFLRQLPDAPSWSLIEELSASTELSNVSKAQYSQPLCTAIQIALVDLLRAVGIHLVTVVGHSSGEIGAAYAAGILTARDAMGISYYRGLVARFAKGDHGQLGGMVAVGLGMQEAQKVCSTPQFAGRISVAACNGPSSVTLAGDADAAKEMKAYCDGREIFARQLHVDTAYHSHHMQRCAEAYRRYLKDLHIRIQAPSGQCRWFSSVLLGQEITSDNADMNGLEYEYWVNNMIQPVLFSQAVERAWTAGGPFPMAIEIGPHPALRGPVQQTLKGLGVEASTIPYTWCLERRYQDCKSLLSAIGSIWCHLGPSAVNLNQWREQCGAPQTQQQVLKGLPKYPWDHSQIYWHESRISRTYRLNSHPPHELLGRIQEHQPGTLIQWRNIFHLSELPWLRGHCFQGQAIFPAAGYVAMAIEAAKAFSNDQTVQLLEISDLQIAKALVLEEGGKGTETLFTMRSRFEPQPSTDAKVVTAEFVALCASGGDAVERSCSGTVCMHLNSSGSESLLPDVQVSPVELPPLSVDRFFQATTAMGIEYDGIFKAFSSLNRIRGHSKASAEWASGLLGTEYMLHPALLDVSFQAGVATLVSIADSALGSTYLPASIKRVLIDPKLDFSRADGATAIRLEAYQSDTSSRDCVEIDINVHCSPDSNATVQIEGLVLKPVGEPSASEDRNIFATTVWDLDPTYGLPSPTRQVEFPDEVDYIIAVERTALYFMQSLAQDIGQEEVPGLKWHHQELLRGIDTFVRSVQDGRRPVLREEWLHDTRDTIRSFAEKYPDSVDLALLTSVGENWPSVLRGQSEMLEHMLKDNLLGRLYTEGRGFSECNDYVAQYMKAITHKFPRVKILEIGAGTGGTTRRVLDEIRSAYSSYTYTDISAGFFEKASERFSDHASTMEFRVFNVENSPAEQGLVEGSYDIVIAANVLHATRRLDETMRNARSLLRPGGYLIAVEVTGSMLRESGLMGGLEGWWLGGHDGRFPGPGISDREWHSVLQRSGFSGVDSIVYDMPDTARHNCSVFVARAIDERIEHLDDPLSASVDCTQESRVLILGGKSLQAARLVDRARKLLKQFTSSVAVCGSIEELDLSIVAPNSSILSLVDLDQPLFSKSLTTIEIDNLQELLGNARNVVWVTAGRRGADPYANMMIGIGRALVHELPHVQMQFLDFESDVSLDAKEAVSCLLRLSVLGADKDWKNSEILWATEPELVVSKDGVLIPRLVADKSANETLNAGRRVIRKKVKPSEHVKLLLSGPGKGEIVASRDTSSSQSQPELVTINVHHSVALSPRLGDDSCFLCSGVSQITGCPVVAISESASSRITVSVADVVEVPEPASTFDGTLACRPEDLLAAAAVLVSSAIATCTATYQDSLLVHDCPAQFLSAIQIAGVRLRKKIVFVGSLRSGTGPDYIHIHPLGSERTIRRQLPRNIGVVLTFAPAVPQQIVACLPQHCTVLTFDARKIPRQASAISSAFLLSQGLPSSPNMSVTKIVDADCQTLSKPARDPVIIDWRRTDPISAILPALDPQEYFAEDKTYFLVGMAGELGQSLCTYMVANGARYLVVASRNPPADAHWVSELRKLGADLRMIKMDVSKRAEVQEAVLTIRRELPPVAGVANAALVLDDTLFVNATVDNIQKQLAPKVDGSRYLDEAFANSDLDFFIAFSSLGSVYGNPGQSIYHAANLFMTSLVQRRRRQGQAGSVINVGMIVDVGYVARNEREHGYIEDHLRAQFYTPLAETEFHQLFLQGIISGHPASSTSGGEVTMGIQAFVDDPAATNRPGWYENPFFSHMVASHTSSDPSKETTGNPMQKCRLELDNAHSLAEARDALQNLFCYKIEATMKIPASTVDVRAPLSDLGLDSLLAVEIRSWLLKDLQVDIPILKIMGRDPIASLCDIAARQRLPDVMDETSRKELASPSQSATPVVQPRASTVPDPINMPSPEPFSEKNKDDPGSVELPQLPLITESTKHVNYASSAESSGSVDETHTSFSQSKATPSVSSESSAAELLMQPKQFLPSQNFQRQSPLSYSQSSMHFIHNYLEDPTTFNVTAQYEIHGPLNVGRFARALDRTLSRHDAYRTCLFTQTGSLDPVQAVYHSSSAENSRLTHITNASHDNVSSTFADLAGRKWDLAEGRTFEAVLITHAPEHHTLVVGCHHIIMDGMSWHIFLTDLNNAYTMRPFLSPTVSYLDFADEQNHLVESGEIKDQIQYWMQEMRPTPETLPLLPIANARRRPSRKSYGNHRKQCHIPAEVSRRVKSASQECGATPMHFYLAVMQVLFARMLDIEDLCIGVTDTGRGDSGRFDNTVGHFTNLLPMRFGIDVDAPFSKLLSKTTDTALRAYSHSDVPIDLLISHLNVHRSADYPPLFQVAFNYRVGDLLNRDLGPCRLILAKYEDARTPYDLTFNVTIDSRGSNLVELASNDQLYSAEATETILETYATWLSSLVANTHVPIREGKLASADQVDRAVMLGRGPRVHDAWPESLPDRIDQITQSTPDAMAVKDDEGSLSYRQFTQKANSIVSMLIAAGAGPGSRIAVLLEPSTDTYVTLLAILYLGGVYIPLDTTLPSSRHEAILKACDPRFLVVNRRTTVPGPHSTGGVMGGLKAVDISDASFSSLRPFTPSKLDDHESFLLFTSGSTGTPKGIRLSQAGIMNYAAAKRSALGLGPVKVLQQSSTGFDMSLAQAWNAFANGGTLIVASSRVRGDPVLLSKLMRDEQIEMTIATPSEYMLMATYGADHLRNCHTWRHICSGGETVSTQLINQLRSLDLRLATLTDCYGPTEISCAATFNAISISDHGKSASSLTGSVGFPILNTSVYIVDSRTREILPVGFTGEICIGGAGVALGYLDPKLNEEKFAADSFATSEDLAKGWWSMYRTGDRGCLSADGSLVFLGRVDGDSMVKLRGLRIELDEVAHAILAASDGTLTDAAVTVRGDPEFLVAHVVPSRRDETDTQGLSSTLSRLSLPRYMIPSMILPLNGLPTTPNGKLDRKALRNLPLPATKTTRETNTNTSYPPLTVAQGELCRLWRQILGEVIGEAPIHSQTDFFAIGGSSLQLVRLQNALRERMGVEASLQDLYRLSTLGKMAALMSDERSRLVTEAIDWEAETDIPDHVQATIDETALVDTNSELQVRNATTLRGKREVVLTGATAFLGSEILRALLHDPSVAHVHCIAVSLGDEAQIEKISGGSSRVSVYVGSLLSSTLGLSDDQIRVLQSRMDQIIHAGSQGHCLNNYTSLRTANLLTTQTLSTWAIPRRVPLHFISSGRVILQSGACEAGPASMIAHLPPSDGSEGFTASKWAGEAFLEKVSRACGLPVTIHRTCSVIGDRAPSDDAMNSVLRFSRLSRTVPLVQNAEGFFDFHEVTEVARAIAQDQTADGRISFRHHSSGVRITFDQLAPRMGSLYGGHFEKVELVAWIRHARQLGMEELIVSYLQANVAGAGSLRFPYLGGTSCA
ncbi:lovastatin nonaketide synthase [Aspergillus carlsbadensis]|nr:lovastatin nonaketide synthase [Aspergillus carlsbadensis]